MDAERRLYRELIRKSLRTNFDKILHDSKMSELEEEIVRRIITKKHSIVQVSMALNVSESTVSRTMREFYDRAQVLLQ